MFLVVGDPLYAPELLLHSACLRPATLRLTGTACRGVKRGWERVLKTQL